MQWRARWALGFAVFALAVALWVYRAQRPLTEPAPPAQAAGAAAPAPAASSGVDGAALPVPATEPATAHAGDEVELCGGVWVKLKPDGAIDEDDLQRVARLPEARTRLIDELRADPSEFARAAAIWLGLPAGAADGRDALARLAAATNDPQVYALALDACGRAAPGEGACQLLSAEQRARLDPDNATPWLSVLAQAAQRRDAAAQDEALFHIAASRRSDPYAFAVPGLVIERMPRDDASMPATLTLASEAIGMDTASNLAGYQALHELCKASALGDANRRQTCSAVAELFVERSDALLERSVGIALGQRLGWPDERIARLRGEQAAYLESLGASGPGLPASGCHQIRRDLATVMRHARLGEAGALRAWVARSGQRPADFTRAGREAQARAAAAASAASTASAAS